MEKAREDTSDADISLAEVARPHRLHNRTCVLREPSHELRRHERTHSRGGRAKQFVEKFQTPVNRMTRPRKPLCYAVTDLEIDA
jgi:hypothetical protein